MEEIKKYNKAFINSFSIEEKKLEGLEYNKIEAWDSIGHMSLMSDLEETFKITFCCQLRSNNVYYSPLFSCKAKMKTEKRHVWRAYVKFLRRKFPTRPLKYLLQIYHKNNPSEYEKFKKTRYL